MKKALPEPSAVNFNLSHKGHIRNVWVESTQVSFQRNYPDCLDILSSLSSIDCNDVTFMLVCSRSRHFWYCNFSTLSLLYRFSYNAIDEKYETLYQYLKTKSDLPIWSFEKFWRYLSNLGGLFCASTFP